MQSLPNIGDEFCGNRLVKIAATPDTDNPNTWSVLCQYENGDVEIVKRNALSPEDLFNRLTE